MFLDKHAVFVCTFQAHVAGQRVLFQHMTCPLCSARTKAIDG